MKNFKILLIGTLPPQLGSKNFGGVAAAVWSLANALKKTQTSFAVAGIGKYYGGNKTINGISIYGFKLNIKVIFETIKIVLKNKQQFIKLLTKNKLRLIYALYYLNYIHKTINFNCIHLHHVYNQFPLALKILKLNKPIIITVHSYTEILKTKSNAKKRELIKNFQKQFQLADYIIHVSQSVKQQGIDLGLTWLCDDTVIYNGLTFSFTKLASYTDIVYHNKKICFAGSLITQKGIWRLLEALYILNTDIEETAIAGVGRLQNDLLKYIQKKHINANLLGYLNQDDLLNQMATASVFVVPSISESFGLVYIEALLVGTPVIGYHQTLLEFRQVLGCTEQENDWLTPYNYKQEDAQDLAQKIRYSLNIKKRDTYHQEYDSIKQKIINTFSWKKIIQQYKFIYDKFTPNI